MTKFEILSEIIDVASVLIKTDCDDIMHKREEFIAFLNELGIRNEQGRELNMVSFKKLVDSLTEDDKQKLIEQFNEGYEDIYRYLMMFSQ